MALATEEAKEALLVRPNHTEYSSDAWLNILRERDAVAWKGIKAYLAAAAENNDDVLMEGCVWPDQVSELEVAYRAVFLVDTSPDHAERLIATARDAGGHNNWQGKRSDEWMRGWAEHNIARSQLYRDLAREHGQPVFDIADDGIQQAQDAALAFLFPDDHS